MTTATRLNNTVARWFRAAAVGVIVLVLSGCGAKLFYERIDTVVGWYLGSLVSLDSTQRSSLQQWLEISLDWHRTSQLERYAAFLRDLEARLAAPLSYEDYDRARVTVESFWRDLIDGTVPRAAELLGSLSAQQVDELMVSLEEEDREESEQLAGRTPEERAEERAKRLRRGVERWTGRLDAEQRAVVAAAAGGMQPLGQAALDNRARWRAQLRTALLESPDDAVTAAARLLTDPEQTWTDDYRDRRIHNRHLILRLLADLDATLSAAQRDRMRERIAELAADLESLARE